MEMEKRNKRLFRVVAVVPFCTSMSSGKGESASHLKEKAKISSKTKWESGKNFYGRSTQETVKKWIKTIK